jgi:putative transcriptional regulator
MESLRGHLLISNGGLYDPNFRHTVVLIGEHNLEGALGVVLNPVQPAGPVLLAELADPEVADLLVFGSVGFLMNDISQHIEASVLRARVFMGYSGWAPGQLEAEMEGDSWIVEPALEDDVFTDSPDLLWSRVLERKGSEYRQLSRMPYDPSMN